MKMKIFFAIFLILLLVLGCATSPKKERAKLPSQKVEATKPQPPPEEKLKEIVVPQMEEAKKVPDKLFSIYARDSNIQDVLLAFSKESELNIVIDPELNGKVTIDLKRVTLKEALDAILYSIGMDLSHRWKIYQDIKTPNGNPSLYTELYRHQTKRKKGGLCQHQHRRRLADQCPSRATDRSQSWRVPEPDIPTSSVLMKWICGRKFKKD